MSVLPIIFQLNVQGTSVCITVPTPLVDNAIGRNTATAERTQTDSSDSENNYSEPMEIDDANVSEDSRMDVDESDIPENSEYVDNERFMDIDEN